MTNRIKGPDGGGVGSTGAAPVDRIRPGSAAGTSDGNSQSAGDSVSITHSARQLASLSQALRNAPQIDAGRIAQLQQAIDSGRYSADPARIAARLLQLEQDLASVGSSGR